MSSTLIDIAERTGYSVSTVSRVLHDSSQRYKISDEAKRAIRTAATDLGYFPNKVARGLRLQSTHQIGVIVPDISNPFFAAMVKSVAREARKSHYNIVVYDSDEDPAVEEESLQALQENRVDGILVAAVGQKEARLRKLCPLPIPLVMLDRWFDTDKADGVCVDNVRGAYLATRYLIHEGHRAIAFIQGFPGTTPNVGRLEGYQQAIREAGLPISERYIVGEDFGTLNGYLETKSLLRLNEPPTAILAAGDLIALGVLRAAKEASRLIPEDISLITFNNPVFASYVSPPLTVIEQPVETMGELGVRMLLRRIRTPDAEFKRVLLEPRLIARESVARLRRPGEGAELSTDPRS